MSKSNWNGSAAWGTIEDPTGALNGRVLVVTSASCTSAEDYVIQYIGTSEAFTKSNYQACAYYAFPSTTNEFVGGKFGIVARASALSGSPSTAQDLYMGIIDNEAKQYKIIKRKNGTETVLAYGDMSAIPVSPGYRHKIDLQCTGSSLMVSLRLSIDNKVVLNVSDNTSSAIFAGYPGLWVESGTVYVDSFIMYEYTSNGLAPADWEPDSSATSLAVWLKHDTGITQAGGTVSGWADQSGNGNNALQTTVNKQPEAVTGVGISEGTFLKFVSGGAGFEKNLSIADAASIDLNSTGVTIFAFIRPITYGSVAGGGTVATGSIVAKEATYSFVTVDDSAGPPGNTKALAASLNTTVFSADNAIDNLDTWYIVGMVSDISTSADSTKNGFFINGSFSANTTSLGANNANTMTIGAFYNGTYESDLFNGYMTEVVVYGGEISTADRQKTEGYLAHKFGLQGKLPLDHPYRIVKPTV